MQLVLYLEVHLLVQYVLKDISSVDLLVTLSVVMAISCPVKVVMTVTLLLAMDVLRPVLFNQVSIALSPARKVLAKAASRTAIRAPREQTAKHVRQDTHSVLRVAASLAA